MYLLTLILLLLAIPTMKSMEMDETNKQTSNLTTFLPFTLKTSLSKDLDLSKNDHKKLEKQALSFHEEQSDVVRPTEINNWKRLTTFLPSGPSSFNNHQDVTYLCKTPIVNNNHNTQHKTSLLGSTFHNSLTQLLIGVVQLTVILYIFLGSVTLFHRLLSLSPSSANSISEDFNGNFYKSVL